MQPFEIIGAPYTLWVAPTGTAFPLIDAAPAGPWAKIGTNGPSNYSDAGVTVAHSQKIAQARPAGSTGPVKAWLDQEDLMISLVLWDLSLEQYQYALNGAAMSTVAPGVGVAGYKKVGLSTGRSLTTYAALLRGISPYGDAYSAQYEVPRCYQSASPKPAFVKGKPAGLDLEFTALEDLTAANPAERFGRLVAQNAAPLFNYLLAEDGSYVLAEDGSRIILEG